MKKTLREVLDGSLMNGIIEVTIYFRSYNQTRKLVADPLELLYHDEFKLGEAALNLPVKLYWHDGEHTSTMTIEME